MEGLLLDGDSLVIPFDTNQNLENLEGDLPSDLPQEPLIVIVPPREEANLASPLRSITENIITTVEQPNKILDSVPTPFKRALFWPDAKENTEPKKRKKDKVPAVASSQEWQEYHKRKEEIKNKQEKEKNIRKQERKKKDCKLNTKAVSKTKETNSRLFNNNFEKENDAEYLVGNFCIVKYEDNYFPGKILEIRAENSELEYKVSAMTRSNLNWKWPYPQDILWYKKVDLIKQLTEPKMLNKRGIYSVREIDSLE